jgi:hypothetical protein
MCNPTKRVTDKRESDVGRKICQWRRGCLTDDSKSIDESKSKDESSKKSFFLQIAESIKHRVLQSVLSQKGGRPSLHRSFIHNIF